MTEEQGPPPTLSAAEVERFVVDGFVRVDGAFPRDVAEAGARWLWRHGAIDPDDPATWVRPVIRIPGSAAKPFRQAAGSPRLGAAYDQLVGPGRWAPRIGLGTFPLRVPHDEAPNDAGWHVDGSFTPPGEQGFWLNVRSRRRALLLLFLFTDVGPDDAPTRIQVGSHRAVSPVLAGAGEAGSETFALCRQLDAAGALSHSGRPTALATGQAGDVYLCHPFLVHGAQAHHWTRPRAIAQPPLHWSRAVERAGGVDLEADVDRAWPVDRAILQALAGRP